MFSKLNYLRKRWDDNTLTISRVKKYNQWSSEQRYKLILFELRLEHYLTVNILVDLKGKDDLFNKENLNKYFSKKPIKDEKLTSVLNSVRNKNKHNEPSVEYIKELSFGKKLIIWNSLKKNVFKNKFMGIEVKYQKSLISSFNNMRNVRNGIAHMNSKKQIMIKMTYIKEKQIKITKESLYRESIKICNRILINRKKGDNNE